MFAVAAAMVPTVIVAFILNEREKNLKHQQLISGMSLMGYWSGNFVADVLSVYVPIFI